MKADVSKKLGLFVSILLAAVIAVSLTGASSAEFSQCTGVDDNLFSCGYWSKPPHICSVCPCFGFSGTYALAFVWGEGFQTGAVVKLEMADRTITACSTMVLCGSCAFCTFDLRGASPGQWDVRLTNPDGGSDVLGKGFTVIGCLKYLGTEGIPKEGPLEQEPPAPPTVPGAKPVPTLEPISQDPAPIEETDPVPVEEITPVVPAPVEDTPAPEAPAPTTPVINEPPVVDQTLQLPFSPQSVRVGEKVELVISSRDFPAYTTVIFEKDGVKILYQKPTISAGKLTIQLNASAMAPGKWKILLLIPGEGRITLEEKLTVTE